MSEKRFRNVFVSVDGNTEIMLEDKEEEFLYEAVSPLVERLLNYLDVEVKKLKEENEQLEKKLECCEYEHFLNELDEIHEKVDKGDLSDFSPLKEGLYYWQCKYYMRDYNHKMDMCTRCTYGGLLNYCLKDKCDKIVKKNYEVTITGFENGMSIDWKKRVG